MVYIDSNYCCHMSHSNGTFRSFMVPFFNDKCNIFIEGYCYIFQNKSWTHPDSAVFHGEMITSWKPYDKLDMVQ